MKLAEALIERADIKKKINQISHRLKSNAKVQEGTKPVESNEDLMQEYFRVSTLLKEITKKINKTNSITDFGDVKLIDAIVTRDHLALILKGLRELYDAGAIMPDRYNIREIKFECNLDMVELQGKIDSFSKQYKELDVKIQQANWHTMLAD